MSKRSGIRRFAVVAFAALSLFLAASPQSAGAAGPSPAPYWSEDAPPAPCGTVVGWEDGSALAGCGNTYFGYDPEYAMWFEIDSPTWYTVITVHLANAGLQQFIP